MRKKYDVAVIGGGPAAIFACWEFSEKFPGLSVVMLEEGHTVAKRHCPLAAVPNLAAGCRNICPSRR